MKIKDSIPAILCCMIALLVMVFFSVLCFTPTEGPFVPYDSTVLEQVGKEISIPYSPIWRMCALPQIGEKTAIKLSLQRENTDNIEE